MCRGYPGERLLAALGTFSTISIFARFSVKLVDSLLLQDFEQAYFCQFIPINGLIELLKKL